MRIPLNPITQFGVFDHRKSTEDSRTPEELLDIIEAKDREIDAAIADLRASLARHG